MEGGGTKTYAMVNGTTLAPIEDTIYSGARCENGPNTGVTTSRTKTTMATRFENRITGYRRPRRGPSEIHTASKEYTAVKALPIVGYSFYTCMFNSAFAQSIRHCAVPVETRSAETETEDGCW